MAKTAKVSSSTAEKPARRLKIPLALKFVTVTAMLVALLLAAGAAISLWSSYNEAEQSALAVQQTKAAALASRIDGAVSGIENQLAWTAQPSWRASGIEEQRADFAWMMQRYPAITELFYIDSRGFEQLKLSRMAPESIASMTNHANEPRFTDTVENGTWFGPVYVRNGAELAGSIGVRHADGGVTVAELDLAFLADDARAVAGDGTQAFVVDGAGRLIAHPSRKPVSGDNDLSKLPQVAAALAASGPGTSTGAVAEDSSAPALAAWAPVPRLGWTAFAQTPKAQALSPFNTLLWQTALLLGAGLLAAAVAGAWMARRITVPIRKLRSSVELLGDGDLTQRVAVRRRDEIGGLADGFNMMASRLQQSRKGLEARIDDSAVGFDVALQQHSITGEMLRTISRTDYHLERVLDALIGPIVRLTEANVGAIWLREGDGFRLAAQLGHTADWVEKARRSPFTRDTDTYAVAAAAAYGGQLVNVDDAPRDIRFAGDYGERPANADERAALAVPLKHGDKVEAVIVLSRADPIPFNDRQVGVTQDFGDQALIAIRNNRLLDTIDARNRDVAGLIEQQAATSDILHAVAQLPADAQPVLNGIAGRAARLCNARYCLIATFDGTLLHFRAHHGLSAEALGLIEKSGPAAPPSGSVAERALARRETAHVADLQADPEAGPDELARLLGIHSMAAVPLMKNGVAIGLITVADTSSEAMPQARLAVLTGFADLAVIALENARVAGELRDRTSELDAALRREASTDGVLQALSRTDYDVNAVLADLAGRVARECAADEVQFFGADGGLLRRTGGNAAAASHASLAGRVIAAGAASDGQQEADHGDREAAKRTMLGLPLLAKGTMFGAMTLARAHALPFEGRQAELAAVLADQAALAIAGSQLPWDLAERTSERDEARHLHVTDVETARREHASEMEETLRAHATEVDEIRRSHATEMEETRHQHAGELGEARQAHADDVNQTRERYENELAETRGRHADELGETIKAYSAELDAARLLHVTEVREARALHAADRDFASLQRAATAEALRHAANPSQSLAAVLGTIVGAAVRACDADAAILLRQADGEMVAGAAAGLAGARRDAVLDAVREALAGDIAAGRTIELPGISMDAGGDGFRAVVGAPLLHEGVAQGALVLLRAEARPFDDEIAELAGSFADQAAIAIETDRLSDLSTRLAGRLERALRFRAGVAGVLDQLDGVRTDAQPVLDAVVATAAELCRAGSAELRLADGEMLQPIAAAGAAGDGRAAGIAVAEGRVVHMADQPLDDITGALLAIPLTLGGRVSGALSLAREEAEPFDEREIELAGTLAALAAAAIATARVTLALDQRTHSLQAARREQDATARMLATLGRSRFELDAVLQALARSAAELCEAGVAAICLGNGDSLESAGSAGLPEGWLGDARHDRLASLAGEAVRQASAQMSDDADGDNVLAMPLLAGGEAIGALVIARPVPFADSDIGTAAALADQASIAVQNVRLIGALETRTGELAETLQQQGAAAEVLRTLNDTPFALESVLADIAGHATRLAGATAGRVYALDGDTLHFVAGAGITAEQRAREAAAPQAIDSGTSAGRAILGRTIVHAADASGDAAGDAAMLCVPMMREGAAIGALALTRATPGPFGAQQIELVQTFANEAAIAIESVRLFEDVRIRTAEYQDVVRQQTAVLEALRTISHPAFDPAIVLNKLTASAATLCGADGAAIYMVEGEAYPVAAATGAMPAHMARAQAPGRDSWVGLAALEGTVIHAPDTRNAVEMGEIAAAGEPAAILCVPLLRDGAVIGVFALTRSEPRPFNERQIELVKTFATQAVIATANVRLQDEARARVREIATLVQNLHGAQARLGEMERLASLGQHTASIGAEIREQLKTVIDVSAISNRLVDGIRMVLEAAVIDGETRAEVEELGDTLKEHLDRAERQSRRADSVVQNTLLQSLDGSGDHRVVDINSVVDESLGLAYHGARAERRDFHVTLQKALDPKAGAVDLYPQEIMRALLNLFSNGFDATAQRGAAAAYGGGYEPVLAASTRDLGDAVEIRIRDNGTGIPDDVRERLFEPFFTTKPAGHGTGLGLSTSRDIIVRQHAGTIEVESEPGSFTEFRIVLPRGAASLAKQEARETAQAEAADA